MRDNFNVSKRERDLRSEMERHLRAPATAESCKKLIISSVLDFFIIFLFFPFGKLIPR